MRKDEMVRLVELGKEESFIRRVTLIPEAMCVLASHRQLDDMKKFLIEEGDLRLKSLCSWFTQYTWF